MFDDSSFERMAMSEDQGREDAALLVRFEVLDIEDQEETKKNGYVCFKQREVIRIRIPGSQEERVLRASEEYRRRFPRAWAAFKAGHGEAINGTPLKECPLLNASEVSMLNHHGVVSVEQAAALSDENLSGMGHGVRPVRDRLKKWNDARQSQRPIAGLQAKLDEKDEQLRQMAERLAALEAHSNGANGPQTPAPAPKPKRNRKPKAQTPAES